MASANSTNILPSTTEVLVVGAGPVGLACAIALAQEGQQVIIVDALTTNASGCRASIVHANTMEVLDTIGCADEIAEFAHQVYESRMYNGVKQVMSLPIRKALRDLTKFHFLCAIPQHETERILREKMQAAGVQLVRGKRLESYTEVEGGLEVKFEDGSIISTKYLVGADGIRSAVRRLAGIAFRDPYTGLAYDSPEAKANSIQRMVLSDVEVEGPLPQNIRDGQFTLHFSGATLMVLIPLKSGKYANNDDKKLSSANINFYRFSTYIVDGDDEPPKVLTREYIEELLNSRNHYPERIHVKSIYSASRYTIRSALADKLFVPTAGGGKIFLAGDSAHVHSPAGGQGMNMGICDAVALGRAIAAHNRFPENSDDAILRKWAGHRHEIADKVIRFAGRGSQMKADTPWKQWVRDTLMYVVWSVPKLQSMMIWRISGLANREV